MSASTRRAIWFLGIPVLIAAVIAVAGVGLLTLWRARSFPNALTPLTGVPVPGEPSSPSRSQDAPPLLASISVPFEPMSLAWSADGRYLAAGTWGRREIGLPDERPKDSDVYVVDVAKASVVATLETADFVESLAFSPDGKWLAVGCRVTTSVPADAGHAELKVFAVPGFTAGFTTKARAPGDGFRDLAWSADSRSLYAIDGPVDEAVGTPRIRRWAAPAFTEEEQPAIRVTHNTSYMALAVSPDGRKMAVAERVELGSKRMVRLFDLSDGAEKWSIKSDEDMLGTRLGFTPDGKTVGILDRYKLTWWDVATGSSAEPGWDVLVKRPAKPGVARFACQPAGLSYSRSCDAVSPDGAWRAGGIERHRGLGDLGFDNREKEFGAFVELTERTTAKTRTWRVGGMLSRKPPAVAFSPDGKKLACTIREQVNGAIHILAVPK
jgi:WD40 repeat protein